MQFFKLLIAILTTLCLQACSGGSDSDANTDSTTAPPSIAAPLTILHSDMYPPVDAGVSYSDVLTLPFDASQQSFFYGSDTLQYTEYWPPANQERPDLPAIVLVHGGCWSNQFRINQTYAFATALALNGFPVWSIEYRAFGDVGGGWPGSAEDVQNALLSLLQEANGLYSPRRHILIGHSAGGHLGLLALSSLKGSLDTPVSAIGLAAITDITSFSRAGASCSGLARSFMGGLPDDLAEAYVAATPDFQELFGIVTLYASTSDQIVPIEQTTLTGLPAILFEDVGHFDWIHPGTPTFDDLVTSLLNR